MWSSASGLIHAKGSKVSAPHAGGKPRFIKSSELQQDELRAGSWETRRLPSPGSATDKLSAWICCQPITGLSWFSRWYGQGPGVFPFSSDLKAVAIWAVKGCVTKGSHKGERSHKDAVCLCTSHKGMNGWGPKKPLWPPLAASLGHCA